ncbi:MAG: release factor glutamine methyltransferase [Myxococcota bacterium]|jgi:release factor glutamine methyltransferase
MELVDILMRTERYLREKGVDAPRLEAELLLGHVLNLARMRLYLQFDRPMAPEELDALRPLVARRGNREPLGWILGSVGFHAIDDLGVRPGVLVPRPDSEALVDAALERLELGQPAYIADVGCGSGAIGLAIAIARPEVRVYATDISPQALAATRDNVARLELTQRVAVLEGHLLTPIPDKRPIDWVISNPPYIPAGDIDALMPEVSRHEPRLALDGGKDGLDIYRELIPEARRRARCGVIVEVGIHQAPGVADIMRRAGMTDIFTRKDLAGIDRVVGSLTPVGETR